MDVIEGGAGPPVLNRSIYQSIATLFMVAFALQLAARTLAVIAEPLALVLTAVAVVRIVWFLTSR